MSEPVPCLFHALSREFNQVCVQARLPRVVSSSSWISSQFVQVSEPVSITTTKPTKDTKVCSITVNDSFILNERQPGRSSRQPPAYHRRQRKNKTKKIHAKYDARHSQHGRAVGSLPRDIRPISPHRVTCRPPTMSPSFWSPNKCSGPHMGIESTTNSRTSSTTRSQSMAYSARKYGSTPTSFHRLAAHSSNRLCNESRELFSCNSYGVGRANVFLCGLNAAVQSDDPRNGGVCPSVRRSLRRWRRLPTSASSPSPSSIKQELCLLLSVAQDNHVQKLS